MLLNTNQVLINNSLLPFRQRMLLKKSSYRSLHYLDDFVNCKEFFLRRFKLYTFVKVSSIEHKISSVLKQLTRFTIFSISQENNNP